MPLKVSSPNGNNSQVIPGGQLEIVPKISNDGEKFFILTECYWNDRGVRALVLSDPAGVTIEAVP